MRKLFVLIIVFLVPTLAENIFTVKSQEDCAAIQNLVLQEKENTCDYYTAIRRLADKDWHSIRYVTANTKKTLGSRFGSYKFPFTVVANSIFAKNTQSGEFVTYQNYHNNKENLIRFDDLSTEDFTRLVIFAYEQMPRDFFVYLNKTQYHRDQLIDEIEQKSETGQKLLKIEHDFLAAAENNFWEVEVDGHTDADGNLTVDSFAFAAASELLATVQLTWRGIHESFTSAEFTVNGQPIYSGEALNYEAYQVAYDVKAKNNTCRVTASGGPKNTAVKVVLADCG